MKSWWRTEDGWAVWVGLAIVGLALPAAFGVDLLGWVPKPDVWTEPAKAVASVSKAYGRAPVPITLVMMFGLVLGLLLMGARAMRLQLGRFAAAFALVFVVSVACWVLGHNAYLAATPDQRAAKGVTWSLGLTGESGYILALLAGLVVGNLMPAAAAWLKEATRPEWFIKTAIVILGAALGVKAAEASGLMQAIMVRGFAAILEAYLIYWSLVYLLARKYFKFSREWAAPLASGISICGVSAAITTGAAIRARPVVPIMVSSLVVVFSVVELILLPLAAQAFLSHEPMVAAAWMGLAVKTDGAAVASGKITESLIYANWSAQGVRYQADWMLATTTTIKIFIDVFIGIWALVLSAIWVYAIDRKPGETVPVRAILARFPKFVAGYFVLFLVLLGLALTRPELKAGLKAATGEADLFRNLFFAMTFFTIGLGANFKRLWAEGIGKLALVYVISLFGFIIWIGLAISWLFFHGVMPPTVPGGS